MSNFLIRNCKIIRLLAMSSIASLLQEGVAAARAGQRERARALLTRVAETEPDNATAWLWLSGVVETLAEAVTCLERAVELEPENVKVQQALNTARRRLSDTWVQDAIQAIHAGETGAARDLLTQAVERDETNVAAWWQLSQVVDTPDEREICLENVLALDPDHAEAHEALERVQRDKALTSTTLDEIDYTPLTDAQVETWSLDTHLPLISTPESDATPLPPAVSVPDILDDDLGCPYCATPTAWEDRHCSVCGNALWTRRREIEGHASSYWILITLEVTLCLGGVLLPLLLLNYVEMRVDITDIMQLIPVYLGISRISPQEAVVIFGLAPRLLFLLALLPAGLSLLILLSVLSRWMPLYFVALLMGALRAIVGISSAVIVISTRLEPATSAVEGAFSVATAGRLINLARIGIIVANLGVVALSAVSLVSLLGLQNHFSFKSRRLLLRIDDDVKNSEVGLWLRGRAYAQQKTWGLAALHLRHALMIEKRLEAYLMLVVAYINLACFDRAAATLKEARNLSLDSPRIDELTALLAEKRASESELYDSTT